MRKESFPSTDTGDNYLNEDEREQAEKSRPSSAASNNSDVDWLIDHCNDIDMDIDEALKRAATPAPRRTAEGLSQPRASSPTDMNSDTEGTRSPKRRGNPVERSLPQATPPVRYTSAYRPNNNNNHNEVSKDKARDHSTLYVTTAAPSAPIALAPIRAAGSPERKQGWNNPASAPSNPLGSIPMTVTPGIASSHRILSEVVRAEAEQQRLANGLQTAAKYGEVQPQCALTIADIQTLRNYSTLSPQLWVVTRSFYFLLYSYFEVMGEAVMSFSYSAGNNSSSPENQPSPEDTATNQDTPASAAIVTIDMRPLWSVVQQQKVSLALTVDTAYAQYSWPLLRAMMSHPKLLITAVNRQIPSDTVYRSFFPESAIPEMHRAVSSGLLRSSEHNGASASGANGAGNKIARWVRGIAGLIWEEKSSNRRSNLKHVSNLL